MDNGPTLGDLPEELHIIILEYIDAMERFKTISRLSKYWYNLVNKCIFRREIHLNLPSSRILSLHNFLHKVKMDVEKICLTAHNLSSFSDRRIMFLFPSEMPRVRLLRLTFRSLLSSKLVEFFSECFPNLEELYINVISMADDNVYLALFEKCFLRLKKLYLGDVIVFFSDDYRRFCQVNRPIEVLNLERSLYLGPCAATCLADAPFAAKLTQLYLNGSHINNDGISVIAACKNLNLLSISTCMDMTNASLGHLKKLENLEHLHLERANFTPAGLIGFFKLSREKSTAEFPKRLRFLSLSCYNYLDDSVLDEITKSCPELQSLNLAWNTLITDDGLTIIAEGLKELRFITLVDASKMTSSNIRFILNPYLPNLRFLCFPENQLDESMMRQLRLMKKNLVVMDRGGIFCTPTMFGASNDDERPSTWRCSPRYEAAVKNILEQYPGFCCMQVSRSW